MANTQAQFGFRHIGYLSGGAADYQLNSQYQIQSSYVTAIYQGTPLRDGDTLSIVPSIAGGAR